MLQRSSLKHAGEAGGVAEHGSTSWPWRLTLLVPWSCRSGEGCPMAPATRPL